MNAVSSAVIFFTAGILLCWGLQVIPERALVVKVNDKYLVDEKFYVKRYGRRSSYYINLEGTTKHVWGNNVTAHLIFYEYLHNEYKRSFVEMHFKFCDMINKDPYVGKAVAATGVTCPMLAGPQKVHNLTVPSEDFPNVWPFERCKVEIKVHQLPTNDLIFHVDLFLLFKQNTGK